MGKNEIEKKYLISENGVDFVTEALLQLYPLVQALKDDVLRKGKQIKQGYLPLATGTELSDKLDMDVDFEPSEARLRNTRLPHKAGKFLFTLKGTGGLSRNELEVEIEKAVFRNYWPGTAGHRVEKKRLKIPFEGHTAEIDVYKERDLIIAEVEVTTIQDAEKLSALGKDVTLDKSYKNINLAK